MMDTFTSYAFRADIQGFFTQMFDDILAGKVTMASILLVVAFFGSFFVLTALSYVFQKKPKEVMLEHPVTWVTDYKRIMQLLEAAVRQRSKMRVSFHRDLGAARSNDGVLIDAGKDHLVLELSSITIINPSWIGRTLELTFRLRLPEQPQLQTTFAFISEITSYEQIEDDVLLLTISRPLRLEENQNRLHLRVEPPEKYIRLLKMWTEDEVRRHGNPREPDTWGAPIYSTEQGGSKDLIVENISGGGLRLEIATEALRTRKNPITAGQQYFAQLTVAEPDLSANTTFYLLLRVLKCYDDCDSKSELSLGFSIMAVGAPQDPPLTGLRWRTVSRDFGVRELDDWAYELHLELYRNKGIA